MIPEWANSRKVVLDTRLWRALDAHRLLHHESVNEAIALAICKYLGIPESQVTIPRLKGADYHPMKIQRSDPFNVGAGSAAGEDQ